MFLKLFEIFVRASNHFGKVFLITQSGIFVVRILRICNITEIGFQVNTVQTAPHLSSTNVIKTSHIVNDVTKMQSRSVFNLNHSIVNLTSSHYFIIHFYTYFYLPYTHIYTHTHFRFVFYKTVHCFPKSKYFCSTKCDVIRTTIEVTPIGCRGKRDDSKLGKVRPGKTNSHFHLHSFNIFSNIIH